MNSTRLRRHPLTYDGACGVCSSLWQIFSVAEIISFLSQDTTLLHGTVILTGTPEGVGFTREPPRFLTPGDVVEVSIEGLGTLVNPVVTEASPSAQWQ